MYRRLLGLCLALGVTGCASPAPPAAKAAISVVAAENMWGSIAAQIGGDRVSVTSVLTDPNADPHEFESTVATAERVSRARYVLINGAGYDSWANRLLEAAPTGERRVLDIGAALGKRPGDNPHFWYSPTDVDAVADRIRDDLAAIDPDHRADYDHNRARFALAVRPYHRVIAAIRRAHLGEPVGATENIVVELVRALGLRLLTPPAYMSAVANGTEPPAQAVAAFERDVDHHAYRVLFYNVQTATALTAAAQREARAHGIPVVPVTETMVPPNGRFQDWQRSQLEALQRALSR